MDVHLESSEQGKRGRLRLVRGKLRTEIRGEENPTFEKGENRGEVGMMIGKGEKPFIQ